MLEELKLHGQTQCRKALLVIGYNLNNIVSYREGLDCEILDTIQSPLINGYRTKCEFTIGKNLEGDKTVGFLLGLYRDGVTAVLGPDECLHIPEKAKQVAKAMEVFVL